MIPTTYIQEALHRYSEQHSNYPETYLNQIERLTNLQTTAPQMLSGTIQGRLLSLLSKLHTPQCALEIGTFTGYSALCIAEGLSGNGILHTIDIDDQYDSIIDYIKSHIPLASKIIFHKGDAKTIIPQLNQFYDFIFIDATKKEYPEYLKIVEPYVQKGALLISDNVLYSGKVLDENKDLESRVLDSYNKYLLQSDQWEVMILPFRDGISIAQKV